MTKIPERAWRRFSKPTILRFEAPTAPMRPLAWHWDGSLSPISDWMLEGHCDGVDLATALLHTSCPKLAIIFISGQPMDELRSKALGLPVHRFMPKPVSLFDLKAAVDRIFERRPF